MIPANGFWYLFYDDNQKIYGKTIHGFNEFADTSFCLIREYQKFQTDF